MAQSEGFIHRDGKIVKAMITEKASGATWATLPNGLTVIGYEEEPVEELDPELSEAITALEVGKPTTGRALLKALGIER